jgi:hypothetical protein
LPAGPPPAVPVGGPAPLRPARALLPAYPGYRLWVLILNIRVKGVPLLTRLVTTLELARPVPPGRLLVLTRHLVVRWEELDPPPDLDRWGWVDGRAARQVIEEHQASNLTRPPLDRPRNR